MISQFNIIIATIIILMPFTQQLHKNNNNNSKCDDDSDSDDVVKKTTKKGSTSSDWLRSARMYGKLRRLPSLCLPPAYMLYMRTYIMPAMLTPPTTDFALTGARFLFRSRTPALDACVACTTRRCRRRRRRQRRQRQHHGGQLQMIMAFIMRSWLRQRRLLMGAF